MRRFAFVLVIAICSCAKREEPPPASEPAPAATTVAKPQLKKNGLPVFKVMVPPKAAQVAKDPAAPAASAPAPSASASK